ncbi:hypothetical protein MMC27_008859 [Xylographa pallens]|nr:hypothetical protein [Xylographa pallens]
MAAQSSQPKSISRWGSLLQQAVAGVESRLDNILADDDSHTTLNVRKDAVDQPGQRVAMTMRMPITASPSMNVSRQNISTNRKHGRLQERLAKAVVTHNSANSEALSGLLSRSASPNKVIDSPRKNMDSKSDGTTSVIKGVFTETEELHGFDSASDQLSLDSDAMVATSAPRKLNVQKDTPFEAVDSATRASSESHNMVTSHFFTGSSPPEPSNLNRFGSTLNTAVKLHPTMQSEAVLEEVRADYEAAELRGQDETHRYLEFIDALQAKLQYLTREATEFAKKTKSEAEVGSVEQKLAIKDEKIVLLMGEGQELAQRELKHMNTIKKLRTRVMEDAESLKETQQITAELRKAKTSAEERAKEAEDSRRENFRQQRTLQEQELQLEKAKLENDRRAIENVGLQQQLSNPQSARGANEVIELKKLLEAQKKIISELRDGLSNAKLERESTDERHREHVRELQVKFDRGNEKAKVTEMELRGELDMLESRLETLRARAEDMSSSNSGTTQAKLLRQIETLQTQYAVASENWRGIEGSLLARISSLESERDDVAKREGDIRRKARAMVNQCRQLEDQREDFTNQIQHLEQQVKEQTAKLATVHHVLLSTEAEVVKLQKDVVSERENWQARLEQKLEFGKREVHSRNVSTSSPQIRTEFPVVQNRQKWQVEKANPHGRRHQAGSELGLVNATILSTDHLMTRRHSGQPPHFSESGKPRRPGSPASTPQLSHHNSIPETLSSETYHQEDFFDGVITPATPERTISDMFSASTAAAGPSVQLVERMSAAVRRLESEKAATSDDLDRLLTQRDEAREQVVTLLREVEEKRAAEAKILKLETKVDEINQRYQITLEMLGEKSERANELEADIKDVKQMYRDLVSSTMR